MFWLFRPPPAFHAQHRQLCTFLIDLLTAGNGAVFDVALPVTSRAFAVTPWTANEPQAKFGNHQSKQSDSRQIESPVLVSVLHLGVQLSVWLTELQFGYSAAMMSAAGGPWCPVLALLPSFVPRKKGENNIVKITFCFGIYFFFFSSSPSICIFLALICMLETGMAQRGMRYILHII